MGKQEDSAAQIRQLRECGIDVGQACVLENGDVFFDSEHYATPFAAKFGYEMKRVSGQVSGWIVKASNRES